MLPFVGTAGVYVSLVPVFCRLLMLNNYVLARCHRSTECTNAYVIHEESWNNIDLKPHFYPMAATNHAYLLSSVFNSNAFIYIIYIFII